MHLHFAALVYVYVHIDAVRHGVVKVLSDVHKHIVIALLLEVSLNGESCLVLKVLGHLSASCQSYLLLEVLSLGFLHAVYYHVGDFRPLLQHDVQIDVVALHLVCVYLHVVEEALLPESLYRVGNLVARYGYGLSF